MSLRRSISLPSKRPLRAVRAPVLTKEHVGDIIFVNYESNNEAAAQSQSSRISSSGSVVFDNQFYELEVEVGLEKRKPSIEKANLADVGQSITASISFLYEADSKLRERADVYRKSSGSSINHSREEVSDKSESVVGLFRELPFYSDEDFTAASSSAIVDSSDPSLHLFTAVTDKAIQSCAVIAEGFTMPVPVDGHSVNSDFNNWEALNGLDLQRNELALEAHAWLCSICAEHCVVSEVMECPECESSCCFGCMSTYIDLRILSGDVFVACPGSKCKRGLSEQMIAAFSPNLISVLIKNKVEMEKNPYQKTCPNCHKVTTVEWKKETKVHCTNCKIFWCFACHSHWHSGVTCKVFQQDTGNHGKKALKFWAKCKGKDQANAQRCPKCKFFIERISGCDHMTCLRCKTHFCYKCGGKHRSAGYLGNHYSRLSFLGCKYNLHPNNAPLRIAIRSGVAVGAVVGAPVVGALLIGAGVLFISVCPILLPALAIYKCV